MNKPKSPKGATLPAVKATVEEWYRAIGHFVVEFEHACLAARSFIQACLPGTSHPDQEKKLTIIQPLEAQQLADIVRTLVVRLGRYDGAAGETYDRLCALIKRRNIVVHSPWFIGWASPGETTDAASVQAFSLNRKLKGSAVDVRELHFSELQRDIAEAQAVRARLHKLLALAV